MPQSLKITTKAVVATTGASACVGGVQWGGVGKEQVRPKRDFSSKRESVKGSEERDRVWLMY